MTNSIYERKRIVNVREFARKSRYMLKMRDFAHLDSQDLTIMDNSSTE